MPGTIAQLGGLKAGSMLLAAVAASGFMLGRQSPVLFAAPPFFKDVVLESGTIQHEGARGAAWGDYDNDGDPDLFIAGEGDASRLYRNNGDGTFEDVTKQAGIMQTRSASSAVFGDFDNDGCRDLYVANEAVREQGTPDTLYRSNCDGTFTDVSRSAGLTEAYNTYGVALADYDKDGFLDIYVANHGEFREAAVVYEPNILYRNNGDFTFTNVTREAGVEGIPHCPGLKPSSDTQPNREAIGGPFKWSYQPVWLDYNNDGWPDLFVATDNNVSPLYRNNGNGTFTEATEEALLCRMGTGMGVAVGDFNSDGWLDMYVTNDGPNYLWENNRDGTFWEVGRLAEVADEDSIGWGTEFFDYDNDGDLDLYVANGTVGERQVVLMLDKLYRNEGDGKFVQVAAREGISGNYAKEGSAIADYDGDGFADILTLPAPGTQEKRYKLYQNQGNANHWLKVRLVGKESNRDGTGARIYVHTNEGMQMREAQSGSSYRSSSAAWQMFGLGEVSLIDALVVYWPSGKKQVLWNVETNQIVTVRED